MSSPERVIFRLPGISLVIPFLLFVCVTPLANAGADFLLALYVFPVGGLAYILLTRTVADTEVIRTTGLLGRHRVTWADLDGLEFHGPRWAIAVATDGGRFRLPMVRPRDLPRLAEVSGGRLLLGRDAPAGPAETQEEMAVELPDTEQGGGQQAEDLQQEGVQQVEVTHDVDQPQAPAAGEPAGGRPESLVRAAEGRPADE